jgi:hypothetical protein
MSNVSYKLESTWFDNYSANWIIRVDENKKTKIGLSVGLTRELADANGEKIIEGLRAFEKEKLVVDKATD